MGVNYSGISQVIKLRILNRSDEEMSIASLEIKLIDMLKTNRITFPIYKKMKTAQNNKRFKVDSINTFTPHADEDEKVRYNLILPTLRKTRVFAGIASALTFFLKLTEDHSECRIIVIGDEEYNSRTTYHIEEYSHSSKASKQLVFASDSRELNIRKNDIFVMTSWKTAVSFLKVYNWQKEKYRIKDRKFVYLIQDFEPGFFPWSSEFVLAESTYSNYQADTIAVFNSYQLYSFFESKGYKFWDSCYFQPVLNPSLADILLHESSDKYKRRKKRILIYGRPSEARNAFEIIRYSLELWSDKYGDSSNWEIISLGEGFDNIELKNNIIVSYGKVTLDKYADFMLNAYAAISLMVSPHPSYPPLEMSTFGVRTITNKFEGKDLGEFNNNIISIDNCSPDLIFNTLAQICDEYETYQSSFSIRDEYIKGSSLDDTIVSVRKRLMKPFQ